jgi:DNA-binding MarR family transcriptional regulator
MTSRESEHAEVSAGPLRPTEDSDLTWLLHRAAQHLRTLAGGVAEEQGLSLRDYIILGALTLDPAMTQSDLGRSLGLDKTTLTIQLDRMEERGLIVRRPDPSDRRRRIPEATRRGEMLCAKVHAASLALEETVFDGASESDRRTFRRLLLQVVGDGGDPGSCL